MVSIFNRKKLRNNYSNSEIKSCVQCKFYLELFFNNNWARYEGDNEMQCTFKPFYVT